MSHGHHHHVDPDSGDGKIALAVAINLGLTVAQVIGGIVAGSLSLIADALHNFSDAIALIIAFAACAALAQETTTSFEIASPPACQNNKGETVRFENRISPKAKSAAGMARRDDKGAPVIYRFAYEKSPQSLQKFIDRHECAHHQTGDIDRPHPPRNSPDHMMNESIADCIAILRMRDESTKSEAQLKNVKMAYLDDQKSQIC